jgi:predicted P-loop ATPase
MSFNNKPIVTQSKADANSFLQLLGEPSFVFQTFDDSNTKDKSLTKQFYGTLDEHWDSLVALNKQGAGIFVTVNQTSGNSRKAADIAAIRSLFTDHDVSLPDAYHIQPTIVVTTSGMKGHAYWVLNNPSDDVDNFTQHQLQLINHYGSDKVVKDLPRVMRLPGFAHMKSEPHLVTFEHVGDKYATMDEVTKTLSKIDASPVVEVKPQVKSLPSKNTPTNNGFSTMLTKSLNKMKLAVEGERNATLNIEKFTLAGLFNDRISEVDKALSEAALSVGLSESEIAATLASGNSGAERPITMMVNKRSKANVMRERVGEFLGDDLQWDEMKNRLRFKGQHVSIEKLHSITEWELDIDLPFDSFKRVAAVHAQRNPYHAARSYLQSLRVPSDPEAILSALYQAIGVYTPLHRKYVRRWLISAVARAMNPGCKADCALVLQGGQGIGKTTFFASLFGEFFQTVGEHKSDVDQLLAMTRSWCCELGEIENAFSKKAVAAIKNFMSITADTFRRPYGSEPEEFNRHFVICGTTNEDKFLTDSTGNRRFWVVNLLGKLDVAAVATMRDDVWGAVLQLHQNGESWWLTEAEEKLSADDTAQYEHDSLWSETVAAYLTHHNPCTMSDIMENALKFDKCRLNDRKAQNELTSILKKLGCTNKQQRLNGVKARYWYLPTLDAVNADDINVTTTDIPESEHF